MRDNVFLPALREIDEVIQFYVEFAYDRKIDADALTDEGYVYTTEEYQQLQNVRNLLLQKIGYEHSVATPRG